MGAVLDLQREAMSPSYGITHLLRRILVIARKLQLGDLEIWARSELNGYAEGVQVPDYRRIPFRLMAKNPFHGWQEVLMAAEWPPLPPLAVAQSVAEIETCLDGNSPSFIFPLPDDAAAFFMSLMTVELVPVRMVTRAQFAAILDSVRNKIIDWSVDLENLGIHGEGLSFTREEKEKAMSGSIHINNFQGTLGNIENSTVTQNLTMQVREGDCLSLDQELKAKGVPDADIEELHAALAAEPNLTKGLLGPQVASWIGKMVSKAATGAWTVAVDVAGTVLANAIGAYYGLNK